MGNDALDHVRRHAAIAFGVRRREPARRIGQRQRDGRWQAAFAFDNVGGIRFARLRRATPHAEQIVLLLESQAELQAVGGVRVAHRGRGGGRDGS